MRIRWELVPIDELVHTNCNFTVNTARQYNESKLILIMFETEASGQIQYEDVLFSASCQ